MPFMTKNHLQPPAYQQFARCFRAPVGFAFGVLAAASIVARAAQTSQRGPAVKTSARTKLLVALLVVVAVAAVAWIGSSWQRSDRPPATAGSVVTTLPAAGVQQLDAWQRPVTRDSRVFAAAYGRAIWTYDTRRHGYVDWQNAVSVFADPSSAAPEVAKSLLPQWAEWNQLQLHQAHATTAEITAVVTPELQAMGKDGQAPDGWHAYVVQGEQTVVLDTGTRVIDRRATVAVVCTPMCRFWSATPQVSS